MHDVEKHLELHLAKRGWNIAEKERSEARRQNECWRLRSDWSPRDTTLTLEFLIDWYPGGRHQIWAVEAYQGVQPDPKDVVTLSLGGGWMDRCSEFVRSLDRFREEEPNQPPEPTAPSGRGSS